MKRILSVYVTAVAAVLALQAPAVGQAPDTVWSHIYLPNSAAQSLFEMPDGGFVMGGYVVPEGELYRDFFIVRTDADGDTLWTSAIGQTDRAESATCLYPTADGGFILIGSRAEDEPYSFYSDIYLVKTNSLGQLEWHSTFGQDLESEGGAAVVPCVNGGYLIAGSLWDESTGYDIWLLMTDSLGLPSSQNHLTWGDADRPTYMIPTSDFGFALAGYTQSFDADYDYDVFILKLNQTGGESWATALGAAPPFDETANHICHTSDGGYLMCGYTRGSDPGKDIFVVKTGPSGAVDWTSQLGGSYHDEAWSCIETVDGGYAVAASWYRHGNWQVGLIKYDTLGDTTWTAFWGDSTRGHTPYGLVQTADNGFAISGLMSGDAMAAFLVKFGPESSFDPYAFHSDGSVLDFDDTYPAVDTIKILIDDYALAGRRVVGVKVTIDSLEHPAVEELAVSVAHDGVETMLVAAGDAAGTNLIGTVFLDAAALVLQSGVAPYTGSYRPHGDLSAFRGMNPNGDWILSITDESAGNDGALKGWSISLVTDVALDVEDAEENTLPGGYALSQCYPNPFNPTTTIGYSVPVRCHVALDVINVLGQKVVTLVDESKPAGVYEVSWSGENWQGKTVSAGVYFYRLRAGEYVETRKMVLLK